MAVPCAMEGRTSMMSTSTSETALAALFCSPSLRTTTRREPSFLPTTILPSSSGIVSEPTSPSVSWGRPDTDSISPLCPSKAVIDTSTGEPSVMVRPVPWETTVA